MSDEEWDDYLKGRHLPPEVREANRKKNEAFVDRWNAQDFSALPVQDAEPMRNENAPRSPIGEMPHKDGWPPEEIARRMKEDLQHAANEDIAEFRRQWEQHWWLDEWRKDWYG
jgi:hypothetical protein